jgi:hypothetical protein
MESLDYFYPEQGCCVEGEIAWYSLEGINGIRFLASLSEKHF